MDNSTETPIAGVIVAAGSGTRLGGHVPKALRDIGGRTLVARSADALVGGGCTHLVVVVADGLQEHFQAALAGINVPITYAVGGLRRQDSVVEGLRMLQVDPALAGCRVVLVHDAARALVPPSVVATVIRTVQEGAAAVIPVVPMIDSVRRDHTLTTGADGLPGHGSSVVDRSELRLVQTPQGFDLQVLAAGHAVAIREGLEVTDDAAVCEAVGHDVVLVPGHRDALKITEPFDILIAEAIVARRRAEADESQEDAS